jgi:hypothetical protein
MIQRIGWLAFASLIVFFAAAPLAAQETPSSILSSGEVSGLVMDHAAGLTERRSALEAFLQLDEVRLTAESAGIDILRVESAVSTLSAEEMDRIEPRLREAEAALAGGEGLLSFAIGAALLTVLILVIIELV